MSECALPADRERSTCRPDRPRDSPAHTRAIHPRARVYACFSVHDWESVQIRVGPDGEVDERASSHDGYNYGQSVANWGSDAGFGLLREAAEAIGARETNGWGPETHFLLVSGGSHAGNAAGIPHFGHFTPGRRVHLIPLEPIAAHEHATFAITPPWLKEVWRDPEASGTS
jgi:hypothetical protein